MTGGIAMKIAEGARREFIELRDRELRKARRETRTARQIVVTLRRHYEALRVKFLHADKSTTYALWDLAGPRAEYDEVLEAAKEPSVWERLVETFDKRSARPCRIVEGKCITHAEGAVCPHVCPHGRCRSGCEDMTDREVRLASSGGAR